NSDHFGSQARREPDEAVDLDGLAGGLVLPQDESRRHRPAVVLLDDLDVQVIMPGTALRVGEALPDEIGHRDFWDIHVRAERLPAQHPCENEHEEPYDRSN